MPYIIDGHNLIPKIPGLHLAALDDEDQLIQILGQYFTRLRKKAEVYFDRASPGSLRHFKHGPLTIHFSPEGYTADSAIRRRLQKLGRTAPNWTIISSDQAVQDTARRLGAQVVSSEAFAGQLTSTPLHPDPGTDPQAGLTQNEVDEWLKTFRRGKGEDSSHR